MCILLTVKRLDYFCFRAFWGGVWFFPFFSITDFRATMHPASVWFINVKRQRNVNCHLVFIPVLLDCKKHSNVTRSHFWKCNASVYSYSPFILNKITVALLNCLNIWCVIFVLNAIFLYVKKKKLTTRNCIYASHLGLFVFFFFPDPCLTVTSDLHLAHDAVMNLCEYTLLFAD